MAREVTQREFEGVMGYNPSFHEGCEDCPVDSVTFDEAALYCTRLADGKALAPCYRCEPAGGQDGVACTPIEEFSRCSAPRLPTGVEFERALRANSSGGTYLGEIERCMGDDPTANQIAWYKSNSGGFTHPGAQKAGNRWGLFDMAGNVAEWTHQSARYERGDLAALRGGSWYHNAHHLRSSSLIRAPRNRRLSYAGFRCVSQVKRQETPSRESISPETKLNPALHETLRPRRKKARVASILYTGSTPDALLDRCGSSDNNCVIEALVGVAAEHGADLVVAPEYGLDQYEAELLPSPGDKPHVDPDRDPKSLLARFADVADKNEVYLVINLITHEPEKVPRGSDGTRDEFNTVVAFGPDGAVVGRHHKFELFGAERQDLTAGEAVTAFDTPFGRVGLLVCADIYGQPAMHQELMRELEVRIVAWSAAWTVEGATRWQSTFARDWNVFLVAANGARGEGGGGGVFDPNGNSIGAASLDGTIVFAEFR
jgi:predicted amidohydrolase